MQLPEFVLLVVSTVAAMSAGLAMLASKYSVARVLFGIAALSFWNMGVVWSATSTDYSLSTQMIVSAVIGALAAAGFAWVLWEIRTKEAKEAQAQAIPATAPPTRRPTLEATNRSTIDATGATIPGDLPFQFGRADNDSLMNLRGTQVTKTEDGGFRIAFGQSNSNIEFPEPPTEYAFLSTPELKTHLQALAHTLLEIQEQFTAEARQTGGDDKKWVTVFQKYNGIYQEKFADLSFSLASVALKRIGTLSDVPKSAASGGELIYYKKFAGPTPAGDMAAFLDLLSVKLPN